MTRRPQRRRARASSSTPTCRTSRASAPGRSARSGCWRRSRPATCRCSSCSSGAAACTLGVTPVLADQLGAAGEVGERFLRFMRDIRAPIHAEDTAGLERRRRAGAAAELRRAAARLRARGRGASSARGGDLLGAFARAARRRRAVDLGRHPRGAAAAGDRAGRAAAGRRPASRRTARASAAGAAASGCPSAPTRPGSSASWPTHGVRAFCVDQTRARRARSTSSSRSRPTAGPVAVPIDWETIALVWDDARLPGRPRLPRLPRAARSTACARGATAAAPTTARPRSRARASTRATSSRSVAARLDATGPRGAARARVCALDTELLGHWWYEGLDVARGGVRGGRRAGRRAGHAAEALERHEPVDAAARASRRWGSGKDLRTWDSPAVAELVWPARAAELRAGRRARPRRRAGTARPRERAARELLALQSSDWAFMATRDAGRRLPERARARPRRRVREALAAAAAP